MSVTTTEGARNLMLMALVGGVLPSINLDGGKLFIFADDDGGTPPADASVATAATILVTFTGLAWGTASGGLVGKSGAVTATVANTGTPLFYRITGSADAGNDIALATEVRSQGVIGTDLILNNSALTALDSETIDTINLFIPVGFLV